MLNKDRVVIRRNASKKFSAISVANNNETLSVTETENSKQSIHKNLIAHMKVFRGFRVYVLDITGKKHKAYWLYKDGTKKSVKL